MKIVYRLLFVLLISIFFFGCGDKTSGVEGKIIDGKGKSLSGVSLIFKQVQPTQGYEQFETKTGADGVFRLTGLAPSSDYVITILSDKWKTKVSQKIKTLESGQNLILSAPIKIRYNQMKDGTIIDTKTGLQWFIHPASDITASNVVATVKGLSIAGFADWRLPSRDEVAALHEEKPPAKVPGSEPVPVNKTCCAWVADPSAPESVDWKFYVEEDNELWSSSKDTPDNRIIVVRNTVAAPVVPAPVSPAPAAVQPASSPAAQTPAIAPPVKGQPQSAVKTPAGVRYASRKACAEKRTSAAKSPVKAEPSSPSPVAVKTSPVAVPSPSAKKDTATVVGSAPSKMLEPSKVTPSAKKTETMDSQFSTSLYFETGSSTLKAEEIAKLKALVSKIKGQKGTMIIDGHADASGSSNLMISLDRSYKVVSALNKIGAGKNIKVELKASSDTRPAASNDSPEGRKLNRRVDLIFVPE